MLLYSSVNGAILYVLYYSYDFGEKLRNAAILNIEKIVQSKP